MVNSVECVYIDKNRRYVIKYVSSPLKFFHFLYGYSCLNKVYESFMRSESTKITSDSVKQREFI